MFEKTPYTNHWPRHAYASHPHTHAHIPCTHEQSLPWYPIITSSSRSSVSLCNWLTWPPSENERWFCLTATLSVTNGTVLSQASFYIPPRHTSVFSASTLHGSCYPHCNIAGLLGASPSQVHALATAAAGALAGREEE